MYKIELDNLPFCYYGKRDEKVGAYGWGLKDSINAQPGQIVFFSLKDEAVDYMSSRRVFFAGAKIVKHD